ncbi:uncharacterized protein LOC144129152 [Amblyomma americanum]|uniref:Uncharacterized protein n=1 Tax=Amblyomma americanum TaxID=6943 RepID=A0AAQ4DD16_AMBAM
MVRPVSACILVVVGVVLLAEASASAPTGTFETESWDRDRDRQNSVYDSSLTPDEDYLLSLLRSRSSNFDVMPKRSRGMLDFGMTRGASGAKAAKARLGLKLANDPFGPGR